MNIMRVRLEDGTWKDIPALKGTDGSDLLFANATLPTSGTAVIQKSNIEIPSSHTLTVRDIVFNTTGTFTQVTQIAGDDITVEFLFQITAGSPVRGVDYWTTSDQEAIVAQVLAALPSAEGVGY